MPIDDKEAQREYFLHLAFKEFLNEQLYLAPAEDPQRIIVRSVLLSVTSPAIRFP